jgi:hypothetical protein
LIHSDEDFPVLSSLKLNQGFASVSCNDYGAYGSNSLVNMFVDDYVLERYWRNPIKYITQFKSVAAVMSPDFSLFIGMPRPLLQFNVYRNRFVGSVWQHHGINVIPTVSWADESSFDFCFEGVKTGSIVAVSNTGLKNEYQKAFFDNGFEQMKKRIEPKLILFQCHKNKRHLYSEKNIIFLDSFFERKRKIWAAE